MIRVGVLMLCAKRCGDHFANCARAFGRPRRSAELPLGEPQLLGRHAHRLEVEDAVVRHRRLEAIGVAEDPVHRVAAVARAGDAHALRIGERHLGDVVDDRVDVGHDLAAPVAADLVDELLPEAGRAARVRRGDDPALRRPQRRIPSRRPRVFPGALRSAVNQEHHRILPRGVEVRRLDQPVLDGRASRCPSPSGSPAAVNATSRVNASFSVRQAFVASAVDETRKTSRRRRHRRLREDDEAAAGARGADGARPRRCASGCRRPPAPCRGSRAPVRAAVNQMALPSGESA